MRLTLFAVLLATSAACGTSEGSFISDYSRAGCQVEQECNGDAFDAQFEDIADCTEQFEALLEGFGAGEGCTFDGGEAKRCLRAVRGMSCDDWDSSESDACDDVYTDCADDTDA